MKSIIKYNRLPYQKSFDESEKFYDLLSAGYGAGKTFSLCMKMLKLAKVNRGLPGGLLCPNLKMFKRDVLPTLEEICFQFKLPIKFHRQDYFLTFPTLGVKVLVFHSEDDGHSIKGPNLAWGVINEVNLCTKDAFNAFISRIRLKRAKLRQCAMSGTPEGFNWLYDFFIKSPRDDADVFFGDMRQNIYVAEEYAQMLVNSYDDVVAQQYVEGKFVNVNGLAALYKFNRKDHVRQGVEKIEGAPIWVSCDFNRTPMTATLYNKMPETERIWLRGFDEVKIPKADTHILARTIIEKAKGEKNIVIFPDPAGKHEDTRSDTTDIEILEGYFDDIRHRNSIRSVRGALNAANTFLGKKRVILDEETCQNTIVDFEQTALKEGTNELDKTNKDRSHFVDGFKNMVEYEWPIQAPEGKWKNQTTSVRIR